MAQQRRTREQWRELVRAWPGSGLTQQAYCERHGVSPSSLARWRAIVSQEPASLPSARAQPVRLLPVQWVTPEHRESSPLTLVLKDGQRLEIAADFDAATLARLLAVLREAA
ncbi:transposase [uncultured Thiodictyon sp.]|uniref:IS66 family insertion sequence element accessory protein TnpA n=1 Tax=uncultured Thiodictyon sp. TaxID=1846217 RepID=UPI0025F76BAF|nr:transposase [uncultured Thiodictyon sp.]